MCSDWGVCMRVIQVSVSSRKEITLIRWCHHPHAGMCGSPVMGRGMIKAGASRDSKGNVGMWFFGLIAWGLEADYQNQKVIKSDMWHIQCHISDVNSCVCAGKPEERISAYLISFLHFCVQDVQQKQWDTSNSPGFWGAFLLYAIMAFEWWYLFLTATGLNWMPPLIMLTSVSKWILPTPSTNTHKSEICFYSEHAI